MERALPRRRPSARRRARRRAVLLLVLLLAGAATYGLSRAWQRRHAFTPVAFPATPGPPGSLASRAPLLPPERLSPFQRAVVGDLERQVRAGIRYQDGYFEGGEPPATVGVCTDVVIRSFRTAGVDL